MDVETLLLRGKPTDTVRDVGSPRGKKWLKTTIYRILINKVYTGTLVWGIIAKDKASPVRVETHSRP